MCDSRVDAVARCLAKADGRHVPAAEWAGVVGNRYRHTAQLVLDTLARFDEGAHSGGLPHATVHRQEIPGTRITVHFDKALPHV